MALDAAAGPARRGGGALVPANCGFDVNWSEYFSSAMRASR
jgi:hypothetical protein